MNDSIHPVDRHVGARIRERRKALAITQTTLGTRLGLTFQQVQKYERGSNRISASKLYETAAILETTVGWFYQGLGPAAGEVSDLERMIPNLCLAPGLSPEAHTIINEMIRLFTSQGERANENAKSIVRTFSSPTTRQFRAPTPNADPCQNPVTSEKSRPIAAAGNAIQQISRNVVRPPS